MRNFLVPLSNDLLLVVERSAVENDLESTSLSNLSNIDSLRGMGLRGKKSSVEGLISASLEGVSGSSRALLNPVSDRLCRLASPAD